MSRRRGLAYLGVVLLIAGATACGHRTAGQPTAVTSASPSPVTATTQPPADGYQASSMLIDDTRGTTVIKVNLPQVRGGSPAVRDQFNIGMRTALDDAVGPDSNTTVDDGSLVGDERSRVTNLGPHVVGGVAVFNWYSKGAAHPNNSVATIVIDADTAQPVLLNDIWTDPQAAAERLSTLVPQIDSRVDPLTPPALDTFLNWVPTPEGFHVYVPVAHALGDYLPVTVPWDQIADLMKPERRSALTG